MTHSDERLLRAVAAGATSVPAARRALSNLSLPAFSATLNRLLAEELLRRGRGRRLTLTTAGQARLNPTPPEPPAKLRGHLAVDNRPPVRAGSMAFMDAPSLINGRSIG